MQLLVVAILGVIRSIRCGQVRLESREEDEMLGREYPRYGKAVRDLTFQTSGTVARQTYPRSGIK